MDADGFPCYNHTEQYLLADEECNESSLYTEVFMKKKFAVVCGVIASLAIIGIIIISAYRSSEPYRKKQAAIQAEQTASMKDYKQNADGTWDCAGYTYKYKLEITGRMPNAACNSTFVYLSNIEHITFDQAWKAAGLSSNSNDYFDIKDAILVDWINEESFISTAVSSFGLQI